MFVNDKVWWTLRSKPDINVYKELHMQDKRDFAEIRMMWSTLQAMGHGSVLFCFFVVRKRKINT
ncbi:hypothetical protein ASL14_14695 [Paenibacillus sp. IHB B 3084]|nr:hypothetical protein ASL14_14695 [Paenibacillus sp. IHB B 3084]